MAVLLEKTKVVSSEMTKVVLKVVLLEMMKVVMTVEQMVDPMEKLVHLKAVMMVDLLKLVSMMVH